MIVITVELSNIHYREISGYNADTVDWLHILQMYGSYACNMKWIIRIKEV